MIMTAICTSSAALNFGMDENAVGEAVIQYTEEFNITEINIQGLTVATPYLLPFLALFWQCYSVR